MAFIQDMDAAYRDADLVICRAGASTVTEVAAAGVAALFIPLPNAIDDHQSANARTLVDQSAAWMIPQGQLASQEMAHWLAGISRSDLMERAGKARGHAMHGAARRAAEMVVSIRGRRPLGGSV